MRHTDEQIRAASTVLLQNIPNINGLAASALSQAILDALPEASNEAIVLEFGEKGQLALADLFSRIGEVCNGQRMALQAAGFDSDTAEMMAANAYTATVSHYVHAAG